MKKIRNCSECQFIKGNVYFSVPVYYCGESDWLIPQDVNYSERIVTFKRIPMSCPRSENEVIKSENPSSPEFWSIISFPKVADGVS